VFRIDERRLAAELLRFGDNLQREGGLTSRFRTINLNDASARKAADAKRGVNRKASGRDPPFTGTRTSLLPSRMMEPLPYDFSITAIAFSKFFCFSSAMSHLGGEKLGKLPSGAERVARDLAEEGLYHFVILVR